jgi:glycine/D-amino acid oxidase-like deaminating enzyme
MKYDYLVLGTGLAGSLLIHALIRRGRKVLVFDPCLAQTTSRVAAGLFNPLTGPTMAMTWRADVLFDFLHRYYPALEEELETSFFRTMHMYRPFTDYAEQNDWLGRQHDAKYGQYLHKVYTEHHPDGDVHDHFGGLMLSKTGYVETAPMLDALRAYIGDRADLIPERCIEQEVRAERRGIEYGKYRASRFVMCTGIDQIQAGSWFNWLPIRPLKGEILTIKTDRPLKTLYNRACFIIPGTDSIHRAGSTYCRGDNSTNTTEKARSEISIRIRTLLRRGFDVVGQQAGVRPTVPDRRPLLGTHPQSDRVAVFNGLGTKGVTLAPYYAEQMARFLEHGTELDPEVNIKRYYSLYFESLVE